MTTQSEVHTTIDFIARTSYGKILAYLSAITKDIQASEDALSDAFKIALEKWIDDGVPLNPDAWILTVARNKIKDKFKSDKTRNSSKEILSSIDFERHEKDPSFILFKDDRLKLMFVCCHPSIDESIRTPLMLQTVLGLESSQIASSFLTSESAMMKRLVRAKSKIKEAGIEFIVPEKDELSTRLEFVLEAIYAAFGKSWDAHGTVDSRFSDLDKEAIYLSSLLVDLLPLEAEPKGLLALMLHCESRKRSRLSRENVYIPLEEQDTSLWDLELISRAEELIASAFPLNRVGRFQLEAAIQSAHSSRVFRKINNWKDIATLYEGLVSIVPTVGSLVGRASAFSEYVGASKGLQELELIPREMVSSYQPYWALKGHLLAKLNLKDDALSAYDIAIGLSEENFIRAFLQSKKENLSK